MFALLARFGTAGILNGIIYSVVYLIAIRSAGMAPWPASCAAYLSGLALGFLLHRNYTFSATGIIHRELLRYVASQAATMAILASVAQVLSAGLGWGAWSAIASGILLAPPLNFLFLRYWVFTPATRGSGH